MNVRLQEGYRVFEWPTLLVLAGAYALWALGTTLIAGWFLPAGIAVTAIAAALHSSLTHEMLHGHPFENRHLNAALVFPALTVVVPYLRFRDTHLAHHRDELLTDPYDDPETNFLDPEVWARLPRWRQRLCEMNNTLAGRLLLGPLLGQIAFMAADWREIRRGNRRVIAGWLWHIPAVALVIWWMASLGQMPVWAFALAVYASLSLLKIRTFLEHRAHEMAPGRTVLIEDRGPLALLFLFNNLHFVHHTHPGVPWYALPMLYARSRDAYLSGNDGYRYASYGEVFRRYFWHRKDPVPHPLWSRH